MLFGDETRYWQSEYRKGTIDGEDCGMLRCLLDGTAERQFFSCIKIFLWSMIPIMVMGIFAIIQKHNHMLIQATLESWGVCLGINMDPTLCFLLELIIVITLLNIWLSRRKKRVEIAKLNKEKENNHIYRSTAPGLRRDGYLGYPSKNSAYLGYPSKR